MASLPIPSAQALAHSAQLQSLIQQHIQQQGGWIDFATFMHMALYTPSLGYYSGGAKKFGFGGDFVTAPEISPLFAQALANQVAQVLQITQGKVLELGAGTGKLAKDLLLSLEKLETLPSQYCILEVSDYLRQVQREYLHEKLPKALFDRLVWLDTLPEVFNGMVVGNEVLDAIPVHLVGKQQGVLVERSVVWKDGFAWQDKPLSAGSLFNQLAELDLPDGYLTEISPAATGLVRSLASSLKHGAIVMLDYGFGASEYYHPQRKAGTLMCHFQHHAHDNPLVYVGLQDITAHVNFTAIAEAAHSEQLSILGYLNQANFLINCGLLQILEQASPEHMEVYAPMVSAVQKLLSPAEMGELFKVILFGKGIDVPLVGALQGDKRHTL